MSARPASGAERRAARAGAVELAAAADEFPLPRNGANTMTDQQTSAPTSTEPPLGASPGTGRWWPRRKLVEFGILIGQGLTGPDIGELLGCSQSSVANACKRHGVHLARRRNGDSVMTVVIDKRTRAALDGAAAARTITRAQMVELVLSTIGEEGPEFVDGVVDDGITYMDEF